MKIIYFTSAQRIEDFKRLLPKWTVSPNLSNQNFHNKLIRALSLTHEVEAISIRPTNHLPYPALLGKTVKEGNITWKYVPVSHDKINKWLFLTSRAIKCAGEPAKDDVVITDTLNLSILKAAIRYARKYNLKILGVCTDNPLNISFTSESYRNNVLSLGRSLDGFICLTEKLSELYDKEGKPAVVIDGITEASNKRKCEHEIKDPYIFFGGSLMAKYGVYNLIRAFEALNRTHLKLVLCGHHEERNLKAYLKHCKNVIYLGALDYDEVNVLEKGALVAVNPRPAMNEIDECSVPSKTLEYLANGVLTITTRNQFLEKNYKECIVWAETGSAEDLQAALEVALNMSEAEQNKMKKLAKDVVDKRTSFGTVNRIIESLL